MRQLTPSSACGTEDATDLEVGVQESFRARTVLESRLVERFVFFVRHRLGIAIKQGKSERSSEIS